jgi:hypothetical protein
LDLSADEPLGVWLSSPAAGPVSSTISWSPAGSYDSTLSLLTLKAVAAPAQPISPGTVVGPWTVVQSAFGSVNAPKSSSATLSVTLPAGTTAGDQVLVVVTGSTSGVPAPTVTAGGGLTLLGGFAGPVAGKYNPSVETFVASNVAGGVSSFSLSITGAPGWGAFETAAAVELKGPQLTLDQSTTATGTSTTTSLTASGISASSSGELEVAAAGFDNNPTAVTGPSGATAALDLSADEPLGVWLSSPAAGPVSSTISWSPAGSYDSTLSLLTLK